VAQELGENAMIGSTIKVEGMTLPYRPVAIMAYHMAQQELGFQAIRAMTMVMMLLGAVGAVGGQLSDFTWKIHKNYKGLDNIEITDSPNVYLNKSKFYPINSNNSSVVAQVMLEPEKYGVDYVPEVCIIHMANPLGSFPDYDVNFEAYKKFKFVAVIDPWLSRTADLFADVVLPAATIEKYEGPISATDQYTDAQALRIPPMEPLFDSRGDIQIYLDLCEKAGILYGEDGYLDQVNKALKLEEPNALALDRKPTEREIFDIWAKAQGYEEGVAFFEKNGVKVKGPVAATKRYGYATDPPFGGVIHRLYGESLLRYQQEMKAKGAEEIYWQDYTALPTWRPLTLDGSPSEYDLYLLSFHMIEFKQSRTPIPLVVELAPKQFLEINPQTAKTRGINDGDEVWVESHNAVTGETRKIKVTARYRELIRPDAVAMPHHYGDYARHPWTQDQGPTPNTLFFTGEGYVANTADQTFHVKVRVTKA
jgi:anaerobic selenocysteine-containing dehydrogenase